MNFSEFTGKYGLQLLLLFVMVCVSNFIFLTLAIFAVAFIEDTTYTWVATEGFSPGAISVFSRYTMLVLNQVGTYLLPALIFAGFWQQSRQKYLQFSTKIVPIAIGIRKWMLLPVYVVSIWVLVQFLAWINGQFPFPEAIIALEKETELLLQELFTSPHSLWVNLFFLALLPAIFEEVMFRGVLQKLFIGLVKKQWLGIFITAFVFAFIHVQFLSFLPRFFTGIVLGYLLLWSGNLLICMLTHFLYNAFSLSLFAWMQFGNPQEGSYAADLMWWHLPVALLIFGGLSWRYQKKQICLKK